jgi:multimeric flavodoxin WrbA/putative sterol carrier protein
LVPKESVSNENLTIRPFNLATGNGAHTFGGPINQLIQIVMKNLLSYLPFALMIAINVFAQGAGFRIPNLLPFVWIFTGLIVLDLILALVLRVKSYFVYGICAISVAGLLAILFWPAAGQVYVENVIAAMYVGLFLVAFFPPLFKAEPFTVEFSKNRFPETITGGSQFRKINLIINYIWAGLFAASVALSIVHYPTDEAYNTIIATLVPIAVLLAAGLPATIMLPGILMGKVAGEKLHFKTVGDLFTSMPFGLNREKAAGVDAAVQFYLSGNEPVTCYLEISGGKCKFEQGEHQSARTVIRCDSDLWLRISNGEVSSDQAYLNGEFQVEGDATFMLRFAEMFSPSVKKAKRKMVKPASPVFQYRSFAPGKIRNIAVFDGGPRTEKFSKTTMMAREFAKGASSAGANVEYFNLKDFNINCCNGCYQCWTKTPGACIHKDDMDILREKYRSADLVVLASPLYIFSVTGMMKTFLDRLLPLMKPYMLTNESGDVMHPDRYPEKGEQGIVVFSAAGFPDVEHNFDGLKTTLRSWASHSENAYLMGEFFLPAAELIAQPVYADRMANIREACFKAGEQATAKGSIEIGLMQTVQDPAVDLEVFQEQANMFWGSLDGAKAYLSAAPRLS